MGSATTRPRQQGDRAPGVVLDAPAVGVERLTSAEARFLCSPAPWRLYSAGIGVPSVRLGALALVLEAARPENRGRVLAALGPTDRDLAGVIRPQLLDFDAAWARRYGFRLLPSESRSDGAFTTCFGSRIVLLSWGKNLSNYTFAAAWVHGVDEHSPGMPHAELDRLAGLVQGGTGRIWFTDTPQGDMGVHGLFRRRMAGDPTIARRHHVTRAPSWTSHDVTPEDLLVWRRSMSPYEWETMVCTNIVASARRAFPEFGRRHATEWAPADRCPYVLGVDWGTTHAHVLAAYVRQVDGLSQLVVCREVHLQECSDHDVITAVRRLIANDFGYLPERAFLDGAPNAKEANQAFTRAFGTMFKQKRMKTADKVIWPGVKVVRAALCPPPGRPPRLLVQDHLYDTERWPFGVVAALEGSNRAVARDGAVIDRIAENNRLEHALDTLRYVCTGMLGYRAENVYAVTAV